MLETALISDLDYYKYVLKTITSVILNDGTLIQAHNNKRQFIRNRDCRPKEDKTRQGVIPTDIPTFNWTGDLLRQIFFKVTETHDLGCRRLT